MEINIIIPQKTSKNPVKILRRIVNKELEDYRLKHGFIFLHEFNISITVKKSFADCYRKWLFDNNIEPIFSDKLLFRGKELKIKKRNKKNEINSRACNLLLD